MTELIRNVECPMCGARMGSQDRYCPACGRRMQQELSPEAKQTDPNAIAPPSEEDTIAEESQAPTDTAPTAKETADTPTDAAPTAKETADTPTDAAPATKETADTPTDAAPTAKETADIPAESAPIAKKTPTEHRPAAVDAAVSTSPRPSVHDRQPAVPAVSLAPLFSREHLGQLIALIVAFLMLLFAFLPMVKLSFEAEDGWTVTTSLSAADAVTLAADSVASFFMSDKVVLDSDLYRDLLVLEEALSDQPTSRVTAAASRNIDCYVYLSMRIALRRGTQLPEADLYVAAAISIIYIGLCIAFLIRALITLVNSLLGEEVDETVAPRRFVCLLPCLLMVYYAMCVLARFGREGAFAKRFGTNTVAPSATFILSLIFAFAYFAYLVIPALLHIFRKRAVGDCIRQIVLCSVALFLLFAVFMPFIKTNIAFQSGWQIVKADVSVSSYSFSQMEGMEGGYYHYTSRDMLPSILEEHATLLKQKTLSSAKRTWIEESLVHHAIMTGNARTYMDLYPVIYAVSLLSAAAVAFFFVHSFRQLLWDEKKPRRTVAAKVLLLLASVAYFAMAATLAISSNKILRYADLAGSCYTSIGIGAVLFVLLSFAVLFIRFKKVAVKKAKEYDDPDISYSPYVVAI